MDPKPQPSSSVLIHGDNDDHVATVAIQARRSHREQAPQKLHHTGAADDCAAALSLQALRLCRLNPAGAALGTKRCETREILTPQLEKIRDKGF